MKDRGWTPRFLKDEKNDLLHDDLILKDPKTFELKPLRLHADC